MRTLVATLVVGSLISIFTGSAAQAASTQVDVRIEGKHETLFEGPIFTDGHDVKASSDTVERACDGINPHDRENVAPGPTPTAAAADAVNLVGESFDGQWYPGYDDYLITRWGPDAQSAAEGAYWGVLVNDGLTSVGGCQYELSEGDEVLWAYDAFAHRRLLALYPAGDMSGAPPLTTTAELDKPFEVEVLGYAGGGEGEPPATPQRTGSLPYASAGVSPVRTSANGEERVETGDPATVETDGWGRATITFHDPGWHRIKAARPNVKGAEDAVRSNRLDVCVRAPDSSDCGEPPSEDRVRTLQGVEGEGDAGTTEETGSGAGSHSPNATNKARLDSTVRYLQDAQSTDGGFGDPGEEPSQDFSAWVTFALAAAGINPQDQSQPGGADAYSFLVENARDALQRELCAPIVCTSSWERELLVVDASGTSPHDFAGFDLVGEILARQLPDGSFPLVPDGHGEVNDTAFAILALSLVHEPAAQLAVQRAVEWLIGNQNSDGSWSPLHPKVENGEVDMTGAAIEALNAAGRHETPVQLRAFDYLRATQEHGGGFPESPGEGEANAASTAWAVQSMWSAGENPETWMAGADMQPLSYLASLQQPDGHIRWKRSQDVNGVWMTAYVAPAFAGRALPIAAVPRSLQGKPPPPGSSPTSPPAQAGDAVAGQGGESPRPGGRVIAGAGGNGAPLFSRPRPQSRGETPGGSRLLSHTQTQAVTGGPGGSTTQGESAGGSWSSRTIANARRSGGASSGGREVRGVAIGTPPGSRDRNGRDAGAPGLHGAQAGGERAPWLALWIAGAIVLVALAGSQYELRREQVIL